MNALRSFCSDHAFRDWLANHGATGRERIVGFHKMTIVDRRTRLRQEYKPLWPSRYENLQLSDIKRSVIPKLNRGPGRK